MLFFFLRINGYTQIKSKVQGTFSSTLMIMHFFLFYVKQVYDSKLIFGLLPIPI
jgi:hypothetical protein